MTFEGIHDDVPQHVNLVAVGSGVNLQGLLEHLEDIADASSDAVTSPNNDNGHHVKQKDDVLAAKNDAWTFATEETSLTGSFVPSTAPLMLNDGFSAGVVEDMCLGTPPIALNDEELALLKEVTTEVACNVALEGFVPILEARGGSDKGPDGLRRDTLPIANAIASKNRCRTAVYGFMEEKIRENGKVIVDDVAVKTNEAIRKICLKHATAVVVRINPGTLTSSTQHKVDNIMRELHNAGILVMTHPDVMLGLGAKDALVKIRHLNFGLLDTEVYYTPEEFEIGFRKTVAFRPRVIKQNRGSQGEGIWICKLADESRYCANYGDTVANMDEPLVLIEANDNHTEHHTVAEFIEFCINGRTELSGDWTSKGRGMYLEGGKDAGAMLVDQRFLPRIVEGEVRCNLVGSKLVQLVHKKPKEGGVSATLQSGAVYTSYEPDDPKFKNLVSALEEDLPKIMGAVDMVDHPLPLLWTVDYIFGEKDADGNDTFHVGEFNSSCVGITQQLHLSDLVGQTVVDRAFVDTGLENSEELQSM